VGTEYRRVRADGIHYRMCRKFAMKERGKQRQPTGSAAAWTLSGKKQSDIARF
jgi:hypothetical protein